MSKLEFTEQNQMLREFIQIKLENERRVDYVDALNDVLAEINRLSNIQLVTVTYFEEYSHDGETVNLRSVVNETQVNADDVESFFKREYNMEQMLNMGLFIQTIGGYKTKWMKNENENQEEYRFSRKKITTLDLKVR